MEIDNKKKLVSPTGVDVNTGLLHGSAFIKSPNYDVRKPGDTPELIVVHSISLPPNQFGGNAITQLFTNTLNPDEDPYFETIQHLKVSSHLLIRRDGAVIQYVPFHLRAWHAGVSEFEGRTACNDFSIGIELEGTDTTCYTASQYKALANVIKQLWQAYPSLSEHKVAGHDEIAPGRKTDPGVYFMWEALDRLLDTVD
ncbi:MAG: 1,6-anhydro-N-acetylmuramyl-L-alanine amidase AmpD [Gammaproteobacteria bacterium]|nr:1,6-anhydro-N-acetylmuramyl-L-alanine amidase AmpD [Gammaproteobacteria bacterium]